jgi:hypothetical protein
MRRTIVSLALFAMMTAFGASKAHAVYLTYSYTGNNFIHFDNAPQFENPFGPQDRITGSFTIDCGALGGGGDCSSLPYSDYASAVTSWSFTAGPYTLDSTPTPPPQTKPSWHGWNYRPMPRQILYTGIYMLPLEPTGWISITTFGPTTMSIYMELNIWILSD